MIIAISPDATVHSRATATDCHIGAWSTVWQYASVIRGATIGEYCNIGANALLDGAVLGDRCIVQSGARIYTGTVIGNDCFIGPNAVFCNDMWPEYSKDGYSIAFYRKNGPAIVIGNGASIGANAVVLPGVVVGHNSIVAAGAVVDRNVPDGMLFRRNGYTTAVPEGRREKRLRLARPDPAHGVLKPDNG